MVRSLPTPDHPWWRNNQRNKINYNYRPREHTFACRFVFLKFKVTPDNTNYRVRARLLGVPRTLFKLYIQFFEYLPLKKLYRLCLKSSQIFKNILTKLSIIFISCFDFTCKFTLLLNFFLGYKSFDWPFLSINNKQKQK